MIHGWQRPWAYYFALMLTLSQLRSVTESPNYEWWVLASMGADPSLDAVARDPRAFVAGLHTAFMVLGSMAVLGMIISIIKGERIQEPQVSSGSVEQPSPR